MEEKTTLFLLALMLSCTWPNQCTKNIPLNLFGAIHLVSTYLVTNFPPPARTFTHFGYTLSISPDVYKLNGWPISQLKSK